ncbi:MAG: hypothetical protein ACI9E5_000307 [Candidatus Omnitrophota bacterium]
MELKGSKCFTDAHDFKITAVAQIKFSLRIYCVVIFGGVAGLGGTSFKRRCTFCTTTPYRANINGLALNSLGDVILKSLAPSIS